jgi:hypothetical protein
MFGDIRGESTRRPQAAFLTGERDSICPRSADVTSRRQRHWPGTTLNSLLSPSGPIRRSDLAATPALGTSHKALLANPHTDPRFLDFLDRAFERLRKAGMPEQ